MATSNRIVTPHPLSLSLPLRFSAYREKRMLFDCGVVDIGGSGVIHITGAVVALSAAVILGPRIHRWEADEEGGRPVIRPKPQ